MAITNGAITVGTAVALVATAGGSGARLTIHNADNTNTLYYGGSAVTTSSGAHLMKNETVQIVLYPSEKVYMVAAGNIDITWVLQQI